MNTVLMSSNFHTAVMQLTLMTSLQQLKNSEIYLPMPMQVQKF